MSEQNPIDWELIDRYLARECKRDEVDAVERLRSTNPAFERAIEAARVIRDAASDHPPEWDLGRVWRGVVHDTTRAQDPVELQVPQPRRPHHVGRFATPTPWGRLAVAALILVASAGTWLVARRLVDAHQRGQAVGGRDYATTVGQRTTLALPDGSQITLAPASRLHVPASFAAGGRDVTLEGEAAFVVKPDAQRPFTVRTAQAITRDVGTTFDVSSYPEMETTRVVVAEGSVDVRGVSLVAGQLAMVERRGAPHVVHLAHADHFLAWRTGQLVFDATPVPEVLATIGRWYDLDVRVGDARLASRHVTATYTNAPVDEVLTSLGATLSASVERHGRIVTLQPLPSDRM